MKCKSCQRGFNGMDGNGYQPCTCPPEPPAPPPCRLQCGACGFTASEPAYKHFCWTGILMASALLAIPAILFAAVIASWLRA
ncbi:hypothetical protein HNR64_003270 [Spongiibacter marinus]|nr:hypothetical protein [Spongiibacter marinus]